MNRRRVLSWLAAGGTALATLGAAAAPQGIAASLLNNLLLQIAVGTLGLLGLLIFLRCLRPALLTGLALAGQALLLAPGAGLEAFGASANANVNQTIRLTTYNVLYANHDHARTLDFLRQNDADVVVLMEVPPHWTEALETLDDLYPYRLNCSDHRACRLAMLSRVPLRNASAGLADDGRTRVVDAVLRIGGGELRVMATHLSKGLSLDDYALQSQQLAGLLEHIGDATLPTVLAGDFNMAPWTPRLRRFADRADLTIAPGLNGTWPAMLPVPARIPIDHVMTGPGLRVVDRTVGPDVGSDHRPVTVTLVSTDG